MFPAFVRESDEIQSSVSLPKLETITYRYKNITSLLPITLKRSGAPDTENTHQRVIENEIVACRRNGARRVIKELLKEYAAVKLFWFTRVVHSSAKGGAV